MTTIKGKAKKKKKVYFDLIFNYNEYRHYMSSYENIAINAGTFSIDIDKLQDISTEEISLFIEKNPKQFFSYNPEEIKRVSMFDGIYCRNYHLIITTYDKVYQVSIANIHIF